MSANGLKLVWNLVLEAC